MTPLQLCAAFEARDEALFKLARVEDVFEVMVIAAAHSDDDVYELLRRVTVEWKIAGSIPGFIQGNCKNCGAAAAAAERRASRRGRPGQSSLPSSNPLHHITNRSRKHSQRT
jgi:hypothetical protein